MIRLFTVVGIGVALVMCSHPQTTVVIEALTPSDAPAPTYTLETGHVMINAPHAEAMNYMVELPAGYDPQQSYPLMVYLHSGGVHGADIATYVAKNTRAAPLDADPQRYPFIVLKPQMPYYTRWSYFSEGVLSIVDDVAAAYPVDAERIYITGYSDGGYGALAIGAAAPQRFAAVLSGGGYWQGEHSALCGLAEYSVPVSLHHATRDDIIPFEQALAVEDALTRCGAQVSLIAYQGETHISALAFIFQQGSTYDWLLAQTAGG